MIDINDLEAGTAGEHLVCADLLLQGYQAFRAEQISPYDVVVDLGNNLIKIQVKTTRTTRAIPQRRTYTPSYIWHTRRAGKKGKRVYAVGAFDILALVALDIRRIAYLIPTNSKNSVQIRPPNTTVGKQFEHYPFQDAINAVLLERNLCGSSE